MDRSQKADVVAALTATFNEVGVVVVTRNLGMTVEQTTALRVKMREAGATFKVSKNSLAKLAIADTDYAGIGVMLTGPVALGTSVDPVAAAKIIVEFAKTNDKLEVIGGSMGAQVLDADGIKALASMPSLDELRARLIGLVQAPATKIAQVIVAPATKLARVFSVYAEAA
ncbi:MAG: 50S ribosomal protein L10 [Alteraurantiacibacter sp.]